MYNNSIVYKRLQIPSTVAHVNIKKNAFYSTLSPLIDIKKKEKNTPLSDSLSLSYLLDFLNASLYSQDRRRWVENVYFFFGFVG